MTLKTFDPHLTLQAWLSPAYPVSGFAYSHGVEQAVARGDISNLDEAQAWVHMVLTQGSGRNDALLIAAAWRGEDVADLARARAVAQERLIEME
ncbi:MAG: urease accessory UreF family protein, partial [Pseudomonadota bacterium]